jgi:predicted DNA-binding transcriptional regulator AlpA
MSHPLVNPPQSNDAIQLPPPPEARLKLPSVLSLTGHSRNTWYRLVAAKVAPAPLHIGKSSFWRYGDVIEFLRRDPTELGEALRAAREGAASTTTK